MKKIERIREDYDIITEKDDSDTRKLTSLVRAGLFDQNKLPMLKRALQKDPSKLTMAERKALLELLDSLMSQVLHSQSVYSKVKQNVGTDVNEAVKDHYGPDPRFGNSAAVSERDMPTIIILKRKSIRVYPDNQKVGLYYSQYLDRYVAIPFGMSKKTAPFTAINEEIDEAVDYNAAYRDYKTDNPDDETKDKILNKPNKLRKFVAKKAAEGKVRSIHYSSRPNWLGGDKEKNAMKKTANKSFNNAALKGDINPLDWAASHAGVALGNAIHKGIRAVVGKKPSMQTPPPKVKKTIEAPAPTETPTQAPAASAPKPSVQNKPVQNLNKKQQAIKADVSKRMSTAKATGEKSKLVTDPTQKQRLKNTARRYASYALRDKTKAGIKESFRQKIDEKRQFKEGKVSDFTYDDLHDDSWKSLGKDFIPGVGTARAAERTKQSWEKGDYGTAALHGLDTAVSGAADAALAVPVAGAAVSGVLKGGQALVKGGAKLGAKLLGKTAEKGAVETGVKAVEKGAVEAGEKAVAGAGVKAAEKGATGTIAKAATKGVFKKGLSKARNALSGLGSSSSTSSDDKKELTPAKFDMKVKTNSPSNNDTKTGVDTRTSNLYRKSFEGSMKEEISKDDEKKSLTKIRQFLSPAAQNNSAIKINAPKPAGVTTGVDARMRKYERDFYGQQNESVMSQIKAMVKEDVTEMQLNIGENTLKINNTIAKKVVGVYESLNIDNKKKMEDMLNEGTTESFMKLINFAVRQ